MQKIRRSTQKYRVLLIIVVAVLAIGLVGSFAVWNSDDYGVGGEDGPTTVQQIEQYEQYIATALPAEGEEIDYSKASSLASLYSQLRALYYTAGNEAYNSDPALAEQYLTKSREAAATAAGYYDTQLATAPDTLNDYAKAQIIGGKAAALSFTGDMDTARGLYEEALALSPDNIEVASNFVAFTYSQDGLEAAQAYADSFMAAVGEDSDLYTQMQEVIGYYVYLDQLYAGLADAQQQAGEGEGPVDGPVEGDDEGEGGEPAAE